MKRLFEPPAYGPQGACFWASTVDGPNWSRHTGETRADVAVIGGGFTGLNAALRLAEGGANVVVLEAEHAGWGASGRNGGFFCLGGSMAPAALHRKTHGEAGLAAWHATERAAIDHVDALLTRHGIDVDRHSHGETQLAHRPRAWAAMQAEAEGLARDHGVNPVLTPPEGLAEAGLGGAWHGALTLPVGFALNPRKYHGGLARAAAQAGAHLHGNSPVQRLTREGTGWRLDTPHGAVRADTVVLASNGYSSEDLPDWLRGRTLPLLSSIIVTRPLSEAEAAAQGWTSAQMAYDSRQLLHYFRRLPDGRFLFGMRGGLRATPGAQRAISRRIRDDFYRCFPAWRGVEVTHEWSGLVCMMARLTPFAGEVPEHPGLFAGLGFHGNGVAMGSYTGRLLGDLALGRTPEGPYPPAMRDAPLRFPLGRHRRLLLAPAYLAAETLDL